jgi:pyruvate/2-oxoglutarate dehydrogenase complex dihydrolipoamide dehydrogenase (E3) component
MLVEESMIPEYDLIVIGSGPAGQKAAIQVHFHPQRKNYGAKR